MIPIFAQILGKDWNKLSPFMQKRFSNRPYSNDVVSVTGTMSIHSSRWMHLIKPFLKLAGALVQEEGDNIPVTVTFTSKPDSANYCFDRKFMFDHPVHFYSYMQPIKENIVVEFMRFNIGWRTRISVGDDRLLMTHAGYVIKLFNFLIPLPTALLIGRGDAYERQISDDSFAMEMRLTHFLFGEIYVYKGVFKLND